MLNILPWQQQQWRHLHQRNHRLPHALLLLGSAGIGKKQFAQAVANSLLCPQPQQNHGACNQCLSCRWCAAMTHPDLLLLEAEERGNAIKVEAIRRVIDFSMTSRHSAQAKVVIINEADRMNTAASNALLKILEEPPAGVFILLVSSHPARLLATIRSRCQIEKFSAIDSTEALQWLSQQALPQAELLLALSGQAPLTALTLHQQGILALRQQWFETWHNFSCQKTSLSTISEQWRKQELDKILYHLRLWVIDIIRLKQLTNPVITNQDLHQDLQAIATNYTLPSLFSYLDLLNQTQELLSGTVALNQQLLLEHLLISWKNSRQNH